MTLVQVSRQAVDGVYKTYYFGGQTLVKIFQEDTKLNDRSTLIYLGLKQVVGGLAALIIWPLSKLAIQQLLLSKGLLNIPIIIFIPLTT